jgi:hypothetical protein
LLSTSSPQSKIWASISTTLPSAKKLFRPGVLSRVWCLGPCDDLRGCEAVDLATQRSLQHTGAEISQEEFDDTRTRLGLGRRCPCGRGRRPVSILRGELIGSIDSPLTCPGTMLEHSAFFSVGLRTSIVIVIVSTGGDRRTTKENQLYRGCRLEAIKYCANSPLARIGAQVPA